ncbi:hypothetical protein M9H77_37167 [Catharanthus roseus]|uniref:Uncharacterized protein n=1 Tax=Catharanthus roseus TaxID=4058 RepID=A0ACB9ZW32_CATRO|nr:hypothetical protein M9H77_37167 [Catharanthus roseus]
MFVVRNLQKQSLRTLSSIALLNNGSRNVVTLRNKFPSLGLNTSLNEETFQVKDAFFTSMKLCNSFDGARGFSAKSMRSKVERRMRKESGKTLREIRRAKKLRKKLMTDEERLLYNLRRAKKKVALLLQKLKKYELPELPPPRHDPEILTAEQLQAYKKIGYKNKNYVPVGVRGVFGGVVQNMHLHWKFHETVQVCCDNFPKEKIKEMASMLARLSGGIVVNIHNVKTIIMFRGRNYRQPKNLIPINTLTKRKALFKARFEQALESQKLNIKKIEQELRRKGVNPDDPVAMASIQRIASTFFNAIDQKEGSPYVFREDKKTQIESSSSVDQSRSDEDSDQEELDRFIAEIEDAADKEWAIEEAAEKEELGRIRYWNEEHLGGRSQRSKHIGGEESDDDDVRGRSRNWNSRDGKKRINESADEDGDTSDDGNEWNSNDTGDLSDYETDAEDSGRAHSKFHVNQVVRGKRDKIGRTNRGESFKRNETAISFTRKGAEDSISDDMLSDLEDAMWESDDGEAHNVRESGKPGYHYKSSSDEEDYNSPVMRDGKNMLKRTPNDDSFERTGDLGVSRTGGFKSGNISGDANNDSLRRQNLPLADFYSESDPEDLGVSRTGGFKNGNISVDANNDSFRRDNPPLADFYSESDAEENLGTGRSRNMNHCLSKDKSTQPVNGKGTHSKVKSSKELDETWDSD